MSDTKALAQGEDKGWDFFGFVAKFAPLIFLITLMILFALYGNLKFPLIIVFTLPHADSMRTEKPVKSSVLE